MRDGVRHTLAGIVASVTFLIFFFGLSLTWWAGLIVALIDYVVVLLLIPRKPPAAETYVAEGVTEADFKQALADLRSSAHQLRSLSTRHSLAIDVRKAFYEMADTLEAMIENHRDDPRDYRHTRRFLRHDLPRIVASANNYAELSPKVLDESGRRRLAELGETIRGYAPVIARIHSACLENDFMALEVQTEVLEAQLKQR